MKIYIQSYVIGSLFGILNEILFKFLANKLGEVINFCFMNKLKCLINAFIVNVYGWGFVLSALLHNKLQNYSLITQFIVLALLVAILESFVYSIFLEIWDGYSPLNHNYSSNLYPFLEGSTSAVSIVYFSFILLFYNNVVIPKLKSMNNKNA